MQLRDMLKSFQTDFTNIYMFIIFPFRINRYKVSKFLKYLIDIVH